MRGCAILVGTVALLSGCGAHQPSTPAVALLTAVHVSGTAVTFDFRSAPAAVKTRFVPLAQVAESGSGRHVALHGDSALVVSFTPAATADLAGDQVVPSYTGPRRLRPKTPGPLLETVKTGDFEAQLDWAVGLRGHPRFEITRDGSSVTIAFAAR